MKLIKIAMLAMLFGVYAVVLVMFPEPETNLKIYIPFLIIWTALFVWLVIKIK